jgi:hypothetical protein
VKGFFQVVQRLLKRLAIHFAQPSRLWLLLERGKLGTQFCERQALASLLVVFAASRQGPILDPPARAGKLAHLRSLGAVNAQSFRA